MIKMKVVLDANIFVSGIITRKGKASQILSLVRKGEVELIISQPILEEVRRVLFYPHISKMHNFSVKEVDEELKEITYFATFTEAKLHFEVIKDDPDDDKYLECAVEGEADYIVSGDKHLKKLKEFQGIKIVEPAVFLALVQK